MKLSTKAQASLNKVVTKFQSGDLSPLANVIALTLPDDAPARNWTLTNKVIAFAQTGHLDSRGYRQWQAAGRQVKKGSAAGFILFPKTAKKNKDTDEERTICVGFGTAAVFSVDDTEGDEVCDYQPKQLPPLMDVAERLGVDVGYMPLIGALGYCTSDNSKIRLATHNESVFFHELGHAAHNTFETKTSKGQDAGRETVAELTACTLMSLYGLRDTTGNAWEYIKHYNSDPLKAIMQAISTVEKVLEVIFPEAVAA